MYEISKQSLGNGSWNFSGYYLHLQHGKTSRLLLTAIGDDLGRLEELIRSLALMNQTLRRR